MMAPEFQRRIDDISSSHSLPASLKEWALDLGLSIAYKIVTKHFGGDIRFESEPGKTEFIVKLPQHPPVLENQTEAAKQEV